MSAPNNKSEAELAIETLSKLEIPVSLGGYAEKGAVQARDMYVKIKAATDETSSAFENAYTNGAKGISTIGLQVIETARGNASASLEHAIALCGAKSLSDVIALNTDFLRKQSENLVVQAKQFAELSQKVSIEVSASMKAQIEKSFKTSL